MRFLSALLVALVIAAPAQAATPSVQLALTNRPGVTRLAVTSTPGSLISGSVTVSSTGSGLTTVTLAAADAVTAPRTGERYVTTGTLTGVGSWIHLTQTEVAVGHKPVDVGFSATVPAGARPGQYVGGIVTLAPRLAITLMITVPGASVARFAIGAAAAPSPRVVTIHFANKGNVVRRPTGSIAIINRRGVTLAHKTFRMEDFLPRSAIDFPLGLPKPLPVGTYTAKVQLTYPGSDNAKQTASAAPRLVVSPAPVVTTTPKPETTPAQTTAPATAKRAVPWTPIGAGIAVALVLLILLLVVRRLRTRRTPPLPTHDGPHYWRVDWELRDVDAAGSLRHLHRCGDCGVEVMARDVRDATLSSR